MVTLNAKNLLLLNEIYDKLHVYILAIFKMYNERKPVQYDRKNPTSQIRCIIHENIQINKYRFGRPVFLRRKKKLSQISPGVVSKHFLH